MRFVATLSTAEGWSQGFKSDVTNWISGSFYAENSSEIGQKSILIRFKVLSCRNPQNYCHVHLGAGMEPAVMNSERFLVSMKYSELHRFTDHHLCANLAYLFLSARDV